MKPNRIIILATSVILILSIHSLSFGVQPNKSDVAARVNGKDILSSEVEFYVTTLLERIKSSGQNITSEQEKMIRKQGIEQIISREVLLQLAIKNKIAVPDTEIEKSLEAVKKQGVKRPVAKVRNLIKTNLMISKMIENNIISKIVVEDKDVREFYDKQRERFKRPEQFKARHILIKTNPNDSKEKKEEALKKIKDILKKTAKTDFAELAKKFSEGPSSVNGGDLGFFRRGQMVAPFENAVFKLKKGEISGVVETSFGYHIIKLEDKKEAEVIPFKNIKDRIIAELKRMKSNEAISKWISELRDKATIEIL